jgi:hypothetical protein
VTVPDCSFDRTGRESQRFDEFRAPSRNVRSRRPESGRVSNSPYPGIHLGKSAPPFSLGLIGLRANERPGSGLTLLGRPEMEGMDGSK